MILDPKVYACIDSKQKKAAVCSPHSVSVNIDTYFKVQADGRPRMGKTINKSGNKTQIPIRSVNQSIQAIEPRVDVHVEGGSTSWRTWPFGFGSPFYKLDPKINYYVPLGMSCATYWLFHIWLHSYRACVSTRDSDTTRSFAVPSEHPFGHGPVPCMERVDARLPLSRSRDADVTRSTPWFR